MWLRLSQLRELDWQRKYGTRPRLLGQAISELNGVFAQKFCETRKQEEGEALVKCSSFLKMAMSCVGMGKGDAQQIRDGILRIQHRFGIK